MVQHNMKSYPHKKMKFVLNFMKYFYKSQIIIKHQSDMKLYQLQRLISLLKLGLIQVNPGP